MTFTIDIIVIPNFNLPEGAIMVNPNRRVKDSRTSRFIDSAFRRV